MTNTDWNHLSLLIVQYIPWLVPFLTAAFAWFMHVAPMLRDKRVQALAAQAVAAAENLIGDPAQRFAFVDGLLHDVFPTLKPEERKAIIEGAVTALHMALGTFQSAQPATPAQQAQATQAQADLAQLQKVVGDLVGVVAAQQSTNKTTKLARTPAGTFAPTASVAEAAHPDPSASTTTTGA